MRFLLSLLLLAVLRVAAFEVYSTEPGDGAQDVDPAGAIQFFVDDAFEAKSVTRDAVRLLDANGRSVKIVLTTDLGGAVTVSPETPLQPRAKYTLQVLSKLKSARGEACQPFTGVFWTGETRTTSFDAEPRFRKKQIDTGEGYVSCAVSPDGNLYVTTWTGQILRLELDKTSGEVTKRSLVMRLPGMRFLGLCFEPGAKDTTLWATYDDNEGESSSPGKFSSGVMRLVLGENGHLRSSDLSHDARPLSGLPNGAHPLTSLAFGPDKKLYLAQGSMTHLGGGTAPLAETPLSASILVWDVSSNQWPINCDTTKGYDPNKADAPVKVFASGIREAFDFCWHSNGQLFAAVNMNDTMAATPAREGLPVLRNIQPDEHLIRVVAGKHYGHPNPSLGKFVLLGGNPSEGRDPWEIYRYPVGTQPDAGFDPSLFLYNLAPLGGPSANGACEALSGPLKGRLLLCFYTTSRTIHTFTFSADGAKVTGSAPLIGEDGMPLKFGAPLDIVQHASGRIYVTDFQDKRRGDSGKSGGVWMLEALGK